MLNLLVANFKLLLRNRQSLFWSLAFPLIFTVIFGFFLGGNGSGSGTVVIVDQSKTPIAQNLDHTISGQSIFDIKTSSSVDDAKNQVDDGTAGAALIIPAGFGDQGPSAPKNVTVLYDPGSIQTQAALEGFITQYLIQVNYQALHVQPIFGLSQEKANVTANYTYFDYVLIGLVGMSLMNSSVQGLAIAMSRYREDKILKRITTTPLPGWQFIGAEIISRLVLNAIQIGLVLGVGIKVFHASLTGSYLDFIILSLIAAILFQLFGFFIASVTKTTDAAESMSTAITVPMMFLAGVFFPIDSLPKWLYDIVQFLPLAPLLKMMREVGLQSISPLHAPADALVVGLWIVVLLAVSIRRFRLTND